MGSNDHDEIIERLKAEVAAAAGGPMVVHESANMDADLREQFWRQVVDFETAGTTDLVKELKAIGVDLPAPDTLNDEALHSALWTAIDALGRLRVYLDQTDHLSERELYELLCRELLPEDMPALDADSGSAWHIDILGGCSAEDTALYLKYYADEKTRQDWKSEFPDDFGVWIVCQRFGVGVLEPREVLPPSHRQCKSESGEVVVFETDRFDLRPSGFDDTLHVLDPSLVGRSDAVHDDDELLWTGESAVFSLDRARVNEWIAQERVSRRGILTGVQAMQIVM